MNQVGMSRTTPSFPSKHGVHQNQLMWRKSDWLVERAAMHASNRWEHCDNKERSLKTLLANWASLIAPSSGGWRLELFPKRKSVARGRVLLTPLLPTSSNEGREIKAQGYTGTARSVYRHLETLKQAEVRTSLNPERLQKYSAPPAIHQGIVKEEKS